MVGTIPHLPPYPSPLPNPLYPIPLPTPSSHPLTLQPYNDHWITCGTLEIMLFVRVPAENTVEH